MIHQIDCYSYNIFDLNIDDEVLQIENEITKEKYRKFDVYNDIDMGYMNKFNNIQMYENKRSFLYTEVYSVEECRVIISSFFDVIGKMWINNEIAEIFQYDFYDSRYCSVNLRKGKNTLLLEIFSPHDKDTFGVQICNYDSEILEDVHSLSQTPSIDKLDSVYFVRDVDYYCGKSKFKLMVFDRQHKDSSYRITMEDVILDKNIDIIAMANKPFMLNISEFNKLDTVKIHHVEISVYDEKKGISDSLIIPFSLNDFEIEKVKNQILSKRNLSDWEINQLEGWINLYNEYSNAGESLLKYYAVRAIDSLSRKEETVQTYKKEGIHKFFIHSQLDERPVVVRTIIPKDYEENKEYPILFFIGAVYDERIFKFLRQNNITDQFIIADITGHRAVGGSYMGEAGMTELITWFFDNYKVDRDRVYIVGQSDGGYATWAYAQNHSEIPAGIYPQISTPFMETLDNTMNIPTFQTYSSKDVTFRNWKINKYRKLIEYGNYYQFNFENMRHTNFQTYLCNRIILKELVSKAKNRVPQNIIYKTVRNRHLTSDWVKVHGIRFGKTKAVIKAMIVDDNYIKIIISNSDGFTLTLPEYVKCENLKIEINSKIYVINKCGEDGRIIFIKENGIWKESFAELEYDQRKGTGILDVYLDKLRIIIPTNSDEFVERVANNWASPATNINDCKININYPIFKKDSIEKKDIENNLILFEPYYNNETCGYKLVKRAIECDDKGFTYQNNRFDGNYLVMQVIPNPQNNEKSILVVSSNDLKTFSRNIFMRKVIIPMYYTGVHPYLNNKALIYYNRRYYRVYEENSKLAEVE